MKFRPHREFFTDAMAEVREVSNLEETRPEYAKGKLSCEYHGYDKRNGWTTFICCDDGQAYGFSDGELK